MGAMPSRIGILDSSIHRAINSILAILAGISDILEPYKDGHRNKYAAKKSTKKNV